MVTDDSWQKIKGTPADIAWLVICLISIQVILMYQVSKYQIIQRTMNNPSIENATNTYVNYIFKKQNKVTNKHTHTQTHKNRKSGINTYICH